MSNSSRASSYIQVLLLAGLFSLLTPAKSVRANEHPSGSHNYFLSSPAAHAEYNSSSGGLFLTSLSQQNSYYSRDLTVKSGQTISGDASVLSGDVTVEEGGKILGNLTAIRGDIDIHSGGHVHGNVACVSCDIEVRGKILGNVAVFHGDMILSDYGSISGNVSIFAGDIEQDESATIDGSLTLGKLPFNDNIFSRFFSGVDIELQEEIRQELGNTRSIESGLGRQMTPVRHVFGIVTRLIVSVALIVLVAVSAGAITRYKPAYVDSVRRRLRPGLPLNFAIGLLFNLAMGIIMVVFAISCIFIPLIVLVVGLLIGINGLGWTALAASVGRRLTGYTDVANPSVATVILGALILTSLPLLLWSLGGCFSFIAFLTVMVLGSTGAGAVLVPWVHRITSQQESALPA